MTSRTLFVGDVHACSMELERLLLEVQPTRCILVGDMFRKGPDDLGVWTLIKKWNLEAVIGNHDVVLGNAMPVHYPAELKRWIEQLPLWLTGKCKRGDGTIKWRAIHAGVHPLKPKKTTFRQAITLRRFPDDKRTSNPFWWELYTKKRLVIYGHDARRGLQDHRPKTLGLDTGCVYGNGLTGYILEEDRLVHVPSQQVYVPV